MKKIFIFDVDNTIFSGKYQLIPSETKKLLKELKEQGHILGIATGRGPAKLNVINEVISIFDYIITVNGALMTNNLGEIILDQHIKTEDVSEAIKITKENNISLGMVGSTAEAITFVDEHVTYAMKGYSNESPIVDPKFYLTHPVYQLWVFHHEKKYLENIAKKFPQFGHFFWHYGGLDLIYPQIDKSQGVKIIKDKYPNLQLICVGDGHNDIKMIEMADIGIAMENSGFNDTKKAADLIAPHIDNNDLYNFFKSNNLI